MTKIYRSAMGKSVDIDQILLRNETTIAIGNLKVNARGDELGPGGKIIKTRDQVMKEYYTLNTPVAADPMDQMQPDELTPTTAKPQAAIPVVVNPDSGLDDMDDGPSFAPIAQLSLEEVLKQPNTNMPLPSAVESTKKIPVGTAATTVAQVK